MSSSGVLPDSHAVHPAACPGVGPEMMAFFQEWKKARIADRRKQKELRKRAPILGQDRIPVRVDGSRPSPYRGVSWNVRDGLWVARIKIDQRSITLGVFLPDQVEDAARAYDRAARTHFGVTRIRHHEAAVRRAREEGLKKAPTGECQPIIRLNFPDDPWETMDTFVLYGNAGLPFRTVLFIEVQLMEAERKPISIYQLARRLHVAQSVVEAEILAIKLDGLKWKWKVGRSGKRR